jgi:hypothetical protein
MVNFDQNLIVLCGISGSSSRRDFRLKLALVKTTIGKISRSFTIASRLRAGRPEFYSWQRLGIFFFAIASRPALRPNQTRIQWIPGALSPGVKRPIREADHSPLSSAEVKRAWNHTSAPSTRHGVVLNQWIRSHTILS